MTIIVTILLAAESIISRISKNRVDKTSRILIKTIVEQYLKWLKVRSKSQQVDNESIRIWIEKNGGGVITGRIYLIFKKFIKELKKGDFKDLNIPDEKTYHI